MRIAFLGLGHMGLPMARNLLGGAHTVTVYNRTKGKAKPLIALGATETASVAEAVKHAEVVITMLSDDVAVNEVVHGPGGLLQNLPPKAIHLCMGTIEVETSAALAEAHAQAGQGYVAAPVFGRADAAASRHIWIVAGGMEPHVNRCRPIFEALGHGYTRVGPYAAQAHALKLGANRLVCAMELAVSETLCYAKKANLPSADYLRFLNTAIFRAHMVDTYRGGPIRPSFDPEDKTLELAANEMLLQTAKGLGVPIPVADLLAARVQAATARGWGEQDLVELTETCRKETEQEIASAPDHDFVPTVVQTPAPIPAQGPGSAAAPVRTPVPLPVPILVPAAKSSSVPEPKEEEPGPPPPMPSRPPLRKVRKVTFTTRTNTPEEESPRLTPSAMEPKAHPLPDPERAAKPPGAKAPPPVPANTFTALDHATQIKLDLNRTSHFELAKGRVWAWSQGQRYATNWKSLGEVEQTFNHTLFLLIKRHILLRPDAVLDMRSTFGGGAKARVGEDLELDVSRSAAPRLRELLGI